jgi:DNA-binding NarL/FixJ family response regulator
MGGLSAGRVSAACGSHCNVKTREVLEMLERVYRVEATPREWLRGVFDVIAPQLDSGMGVSAYYVDASRPDTFETSDFLARGGLPLKSLRARFEAWRRDVPVAVKRHVHLFGPCGHAVDIPPMPSLGHVERVTRPAHGIPDMLGLNALDATGRGCTFAAPRNSQQRRLAPARVRLFTRLAAHIATGARIARTLREQRASLIGTADALIESSGKLAHASPAAVRSREALRHAAMHLDRARTRASRIDPDEVTHLWQALVAGRWSLVDHFDRDGRRYFVVRSNAPEVARAPLSEREAQVAGAAAIGHANKVIAYELGISASSVATHLKRAAEKLGVRSRVQLIAAFNALAAKR